MGQASRSWSATPAPKRNRHPACPRRQGPARTLLNKRIWVLSSIIIVRPPRFWKVWADRSMNRRQENKLRNLETGTAAGFGQEKGPPSEKGGPEHIPQSADLRGRADQPRVVQAFRVHRGVDLSMNLTNRSYFPSFAFISLNWSCSALTLSGWVSSS
jgi:hypothetical protein